MKYEMKTLNNSQNPIEIQPNSLVPLLSLKFPAKIIRKKKRIAPKKPPRNVVSGESLSTGRKTSIKKIVTIVHINELRKDEATVGCPDIKSEFCLN